MSSWYASDFLWVAHSATCNVAYINIASNVISALVAWLCSKPLIIVDSLILLMLAVGQNDHAYSRFAHRLINLMSLSVEIYNLIKWKLVLSMQYTFSMP